jgi:hypothetical protein
MTCRKTCVAILYLTAKNLLPCVNHYIADCFKISALSCASHHHEHVTCALYPALRTVFDPPVQICHQAMPLTLDHRVSSTHYMICATDHIYEPWYRTQII